MTTATRSARLWRNAGRAAATALVAAALALSQTAGPGTISPQRAEAADYSSFQEVTAAAATDGYGSEKQVDFTYDAAKLKLEDAEFETDNAGRAPGDDKRKVGFYYKKGGIRVGRDRGCSMARVLGSAVVLRGKTLANGKESVEGGFTLTWRGAVSDKYGRRYDLRLAFSNVSYCNNTGMALENGIAIVEGTGIEEDTINSTEAIYTKVNGTWKKDGVAPSGAKTRQQKRVRTVGGTPWSKKSDCGEDNHRVAMSAWICNFTNASGKEYTNLQDLHERFFTANRESTWDGKTWVDASGNKKTGSSNPDSSKYTRDWKNGSWTHAGDTGLGVVNGINDDANYMMVGVKMNFTMQVMVPSGSGLRNAGQPVAGGNMGMAFRDIDQPGLGLGDGDYSDSEYMESIFFKTSPVDGTIHVNTDNTLRYRTKDDKKGKVVNGTRLVGVVGSEETPENADATHKHGARDSGFSLKAPAQNFSCRWRGAKCSTQLFTPTSIGPDVIDISTTVRKTVDGHIPADDLEGAFSFRLYYGDDRNSAKVVKSWDDNNDKVLDGDGKHANLRCENGRNGYGTIKMNYWSFMHAIGIANRSQLLSETDPSNGSAKYPGGLFGRSFTFWFGEKTDTEAFTSGRFVAGGSRAKVTVSLIANDTGGATAWAAYESGSIGEVAVIDNIETARARIAVNKRVSNGTSYPSPDVSGKYEFDLVSAGAPAGVKAPSPTTSSEALGASHVGYPGAVVNARSDGGPGVFGLLTFTATGEYTYKVTEKRTTYDDWADAPVKQPHFITDDPLASSGKYVKVRVYVGDDRHKHADVTAADASYAYTVPSSWASQKGTVGVEFVNSYKPPVAAIPVKKTLLVGTGATAPDVKGKFTFTLAARDGAPMPSGSTAGKATIANPGKDGGTASFGAVLYPEPGTYRYTVTEAGSVDGVYNDASSEKAVAVEVAESGDVKVNDGKGVAFDNYVPSPAKLPLSALKKLRCSVHGTWPFPDVKGKFTFELSRVTAKAPMPATTEVKNPDSGGGEASFGEAVFPREGEYEYKVTETGSVDDIDNDPAAKKGKRLIVKVDFDRAGNRLVARDKATGQELSKGVFEFENIYVPSVLMPLAGGDGLWALAAAAGIACTVAGAFLLSRRRRPGAHEMRR